MSANELAAVKPIPILPCLLAWLVPGAGHFYLGKWRRGILFLVAIPLMFGLGIALGGRLTEIDPAHPLTYFGRFANLGNGIIYLATKFFGGGEGRLTDVTYDYGCTFAWVSGLLNFLVVLDAYDIAVGRKK